MSLLRNNAKDRKAELLAISRRSRIKWIRSAAPVVVPSSQEVPTDKAKSISNILTTTNVPDIVADGETVNVEALLHQFEADEGDGEEADNNTTNGTVPSHTSNRIIDMLKSLEEYTYELFLDKLCSRDAIEIVKSMQQFVSKFNAKIRVYRSSFESSYYLDKEANHQETIKGDALLLVLCAQSIWAFLEHIDRVMHHDDEDASSGFDHWSPWSTHHVGANHRIVGQTATTSSSSTSSSSSSSSSSYLPVTVSSTHTEASLPSQQQSSIAPPALPLPTALPSLDNRTTMTTTTATLSCDAPTGMAQVLGLFRERTRLFCERFIFNKLHASIFHSDYEDCFLNQKLSERIQSLSFLLPHHLDLHMALAAAPSSSSSSSSSSTSGGDISYSNNIGAISSSSSSSNDTGVQGPDKGKAGVTDESQGLGQGLGQGLSSLSSAVVHQDKGVLVDVSMTANGAMDSTSGSGGDRAGQGLGEGQETEVLLSFRCVEAAAACLQGLGDATCPSDKVECIRRAVQTLTQALSAQELGLQQQLQRKKAATASDHSGGACSSTDPSPGLGANAVDQPVSATVTDPTPSPGPSVGPSPGPGADDVLPVLILSIQRANPPHLFSEIKYMQTYLALAHLDSEAGYLLTQLASAVNFLEHVDAATLTISPGEFENALRQCRSQSMLKKVNSIRARAIGDNDGSDFVIGGDSGFTGNNITGNGSGSVNKKQQQQQQQQQHSIIIDGSKTVLPTTMTKAGSRSTTNGSIVTDNVGNGTGIFELYRKHTKMIR